MVHYVWYVWFTFAERNIVWDITGKQGKTDRSSMVRRARYDFTFSNFFLYLSKNSFVLKLLRLMKTFEPCTAISSFVYNSLDFPLGSHYPKTIQISFFVWNEKTFHMREHKNEKCYFISLNGSTKAHNEVGETLRITSVAKSLSFH